MSKKQIELNDLLALLTNLPAGSILSLEKSPNGAVLVADDTPKTKQQLLTELPYAELAGQGISITQAANKYLVPRGTIEGWLYSQNYIAFVDEGAYPKLINEAEVALCAHIYHQRQEAGLDKGGAAYFDQDGYPVVSKQDLKYPRLADKRREQRRKKQ